MSSSSARTLIRTGISLATRLVKPSSGSSGQQIASRSLDIAPKLFPSLYSHWLAPPCLPRNDSYSLKKLSSEPFLYPLGLPSLPFFLPDGNDSTSSEPMLLFPKRTYQPSNIRPKQQGVGEELLLDELQRAGQESRRRNTFNFQTLD